MFERSQVRFPIFHDISFYFIVVESCVFLWAGICFIFGFVHVGKRLDKGKGWSVLLSFSV